ncbi:hypothetical protein AMTR_s00079p00093310 [Amborella trichopoda]|uniref:Uncharacterized protein n=1 Tax=Amborella trichopoda TaxID=13333 RepID=W1P8F5_AMBTC|nr:hypothetical protein AMTR_s00079p00093310 [Amborella trichopoda]
MTIKFENEPLNEARPNSNVIMIIEDMPLKGDLEVKNYKHIQGNSLISPRDRTIVKDKGVIVDQNMCINMISINQECTPSQDQETENPDNSILGIIIVTTLKKLTTSRAEGVI